MRHHIVQKWQAKNDVTRRSANCIEKSRRTKLLAISHPDAARSTTLRGVMAPTQHVSNILCGLWLYPHFRGYYQSQPYIANDNN